jgi:hypothetical protein
VVNEVGGIGPATAGIVGLSLLGPITEFAKLGGSVALAAGKFALFPVAGFIVDIAGLAPAIASGTLAMTDFNLVLAANPVGAVVVAVAALSAGLYELYEHWQKVKDIFEKIPAAVASVGSSASAEFGGMGGIDLGGATAAAPRLPLSAQAGAAAAAGAPGRNGTTRVEVDVKVPEGSTVRTTSTGNATPPDLNVGYAFPF